MEVHGGTRIVRGVAAIRGTMAGYVDLQPDMDLGTHHTTVAGDFAMTRSNRGSQPPMLNLEREG
jgi:hypothetical protein